MAKEQKELLEELKVSHRNFSFVGKAKIGDDTFKGASNKEGKTWYHVNTTIGIETEPGNVVYGRIFGGYKLDNPVLHVRSKTGSDFITIPYENRDKKELLKNVSDFSFLNVGIETDSEGNRVYKRFIDSIDFENYLSEHLQDGMEIRVVGQVDYSPGKEDQVYTNYDITAIYLNEDYTNKKGEEVKAQEHQARYKQTFVVDSMVLDKGWEKQFKKDGSIVLSLYVPQYLSQILNGEGAYVEWKKTSPVIQNITFKADKMAKSIDGAVAMIKKYFDFKKGVRELTFYVDVRDGYIEGEMAEYEISKEMRELIDMGLITEDEIKTQVTVRKSRVRELLFAKPSIVMNEDGTPALEMYDDKYSDDVLIVPTLDTDDDDEYESQDSESENDDFEEPTNEDSGEIDYMSMFQ
ncbi:hypothetical protein [Enterococcus sp. N249-2]